jgi:hypothetical protein
MYHHNITKMQPYKMTYTVREFNIELTTNPNEYGYFCDPGLDIVENGNLNKYINKNRIRNYSFNNPNYTIHENETPHSGDENDTKYNKDNAHKDTYMDTIIYSIIIIGTVTITTYLVNNGII